MRAVQHPSPSRGLFRKALGLYRKSKLAYYVLLPFLLLLVLACAVIGWPLWKLGQLARA